MGTYEVRVSEVVYMVTGESEEDALDLVNETLMNTAFDWGTIEVDG